MLMGVYFVRCAYAWERNAALAFRYICKIYSDFKCNFYDLRFYWKKYSFRGIHSVFVHVINLLFYIIFLAVLIICLCDIRACYDPVTFVFYDNVFLNIVDLNFWFLNRPYCFDNKTFPLNTQKLAIMKILLK